MLTQLSMVEEIQRELFPRFISWTTEELNKRQKKSSKRGGFGGGFVETDVPLNTELATNKKYEECIEEEPENEITATLYDYAKTVQNLASMYLQFDIKGRKLLEQTVNQEHIKRVILDSRKAFNLSDIPDVSHTTQSVANENVENADFCDNIPPFSQDTFWDRPDVLAVVDATTKAKESLLHNIDIEPPSFSLGLTQDFPNYNATHVNYHANEEEGLNQNFTTCTASPLDQHTHEEDEVNGQEEEVHQEGEANDGKKEKTPKNRENRLPGREFRSPYIRRCLNPKTLPTKKETDFAANVISSVETPL